MKKTLLILSALLLTAVGAWAEDHSVGDIVYHQDKAYKITGTNIVTNGSFEDSDMNGWIGGGYAGSEKAVTLTGYTLYESGGYDGGAYVQFTSGGAAEASTPHQAIAVTSGTTYYFEGYTTGAVTSGNFQYNGLFLMKDSETEDGTAHIELDWHSASSTWTKTTGIFTPSEAHPYVGLRFGWSGTTSARYDGFQIYTVEETEATPTDTDSDHSEGDVVTFQGKHYNVKSSNKIENHSFELGYTGWTNSSDYTTTIISDNFNLETDDPQNGMRYLVGALSDGASSAKSLGTAWSIETGKTYYFSYWVKNLSGETNTEYLKTSLTNTPGTETKELAEPASVSTDWQHVEYVFDNDSYTYVQVKFRWLDHHWGFDNFQLYEVEPSEDVLDDNEYKTGDEVTVDGTIYAVVSDNMVVNGSFNDGVDGWKANLYAEDANIDNFTYATAGGFNGGANITIKSGAGAESVNNLSQAIQVEEGKTYLFIGYTKGTAPSDNNMRYCGVMQMSDATTEILDDGKTSGHDAVVEVQMEWGADEADQINGWTQTEGVFTASTPYVGVRTAWCGSASFDGIQLYEVEAVPSSIEWEMTDAGWGTLILPFDAEIPTVTDENEEATLTLYAGSALSLGSDGTTITVSEASETIVANTPYLVKGTEGTYTFTGTPEEATTLTSGMLTGTLVDMTQDNFTGNGTEYVLQNHVDENGNEEDDGLAFYPITSESSDVTLEAYHCYLTLDNSTSGSGVRAFISLPGSDNEETGIVAVESETLANDAIYDLSGRRVSKAVKGVYIQNGKKVLVK